MGFFKFQNKIKNDDYIKLAYILAEKDSNYIIENIIPRLDEM